MKAAVVNGAGKAPVYGDFMEPSAQPGKMLVNVTASALSRVTKSRASGAHYSSSGQFPFVAGVDGVGRLHDGRRVLFLLPDAPFGAMAERTVVAASRCVPVPDDVDDVTAAAIANPGLSSWAALRERARLLPGENVLVNGATGTSGRLAVQIAKHLGARKVVATGRNAADLAELKSLGADETLLLTLPPEDLEAALIDHFQKGIDVVVDYLWGTSAEAIIVAAAKGGKDAVPVRFVEVGSASGSEITLPSAALRSSALMLMGSGVGSIGVDGLVKVVDEVLRAVVPAKLQIQTKAVPLTEIERLWNEDSGKSRLVFMVG